MFRLPRVRGSRALVPVHAAVLLAVTGAVAWLTGTPFVFPSLGPTAYVLAADRTRGTDGDADPDSPVADAGVSVNAVVVAHAVGVLAGFAAYHALAGSVVVTGALTPQSPALAALVASAVCALALTSVGMAATGAVHPPACATTLIVSLGLLPTVREGLLIGAAVVCLVAAHLAAVTVTSRTIGQSS